MPQISAEPSHVRTSVATPGNKVSFF